MSIEHGNVPEHFEIEAELLTELFDKVFEDQLEKRAPRVERAVHNDVTNPNFQHVGAVLGAILFSREHGYALDVVLRGDSGGNELPTFDIKSGIGVSRIENVRVEALLVHFARGALHDRDSGRLFMSDDYGVGSVDYPATNIN